MNCILFLIYFTIFTWMERKILLSIPQEHSIQSDNYYDDSTVVLFENLFNLGIKNKSMSSIVSLPAFCWKSTCHFGEGDDLSQYSDFYALHDRAFSNDV